MSDTSSAPANAAPVDMSPVSGVVSPRIHRSMTFIQEALSRTSETNDFLFGSGTGGPDTKNDHFDKAMLATMETMRSGIREQHVFNLADVVPFFREGAESIVSDNFNRCFSVSQEPAWNWNFYLAPIWLLGVLVRYLFLLPLRVLFILVSSITFIAGCELLHLMPLATSSKAAALRWAVKKYCSAFVSSWSGVVKYHGLCPKRKAGQIFVANHTSMIDMIILEQFRTFAVVGQKHSGWVGLMQDRYLQALGSVWFDRTSGNDRQIVSARLKAHVQDPSNNNMLIFPEGTCVNNDYAIMFKKGAFDLGATVVPIAIKYNKLFADAFWNSRKESFTQYLIRLMSSWAVVCDVWFLEPQKQLPGESAIQFTERVKLMICNKAKITAVPWDGYYKYLRPSTRLTEERQRVFSETILKRSMSMGNLAAMASAAEDEEGGGGGVAEVSGLQRRKGTEQQRKVDM